MSVLTLRVAEAGTKDVGRALARLDPDDIRKLGLQTGDVVEIRGKKIAVAKVMPAPASLRRQQRISLDGLTRENAGVGLDETVEVAPVACVAAERLEIAPCSLEPSRRDLDYIGRLLDGLVTRQGARIRATLFGNRAAEFEVTRTQPGGAVLIHPLTQLTVVARKQPSASERRLSYEDVGGLKPQLQRVRETVELPLRYPEVFERLGVAAPKGVLLHGPPGTGKTLIARAIAHETQARFFSISGPEIIHKFYGESEAHLRKIFEEAARTGPSIIFLDEIDSIAPRRERAVGEVEKRVVAQLLALMDGLNRRQNLIVIAATNLPDALDPALRRPGRFDREIAIPVPDREGRREILEIHTNGMPLSQSVSIDGLASRTHGFVGADLESLCREAAMRRLRRLLPDIDFGQARIPYEALERLQIEPDDFEDALAEIEPSALRDAFVERPEVRWADLGGLDHVRERITEAVIWPLTSPALFQRSGVRAPKGILLSGPPGCGKTLMAKAAAAESGINFLSVKGPALLSMYVGESERAVRELFRKARHASPCLLFLDEVDALAPVRGRGEDPVADRVLAQLLTEMDGIEELRGVLVLAATNRPDRIDPALLRPGRLDDHIEIGLPDLVSREQIFRVHLRGKPIFEDFPLREFAESTDQYSGADIMAVVQRASLNALRRAWPDGEVSLLADDVRHAIAEVRTR